MARWGTAGGLPAVWGLVRSAQSENPGRLVLADLPATGQPGVFGVLAAGLGAGAQEPAVRAGQVYGRRLGRPGEGLMPPGGGVPWRLEAGDAGTLDGLALAPCPEAAGPLGAGQVRVAVRAAGLNFRDVLIGLGGGGGVVGGWGGWGGGGAGGGGWGGGGRGGWGRGGAGGWGGWFRGTGW